MIKKPSIIITSAARTGTTFFFILFKEILNECVAFHEPEKIGIMVNPKEMVGDNIIQDRIWRIKKFGFFNLTLKKLLKESGLITLSNRRIAGEIDLEEAAKILKKEREAFVDSFSEKIYVESSYHYYGLIDVVDKVFDNHKLIYLVRDGREWIRSHINVKLFYHWMDFHNYFGNRLTPKMVNDDFYKNKWKYMTQFEKLCWCWTKINEYALTTIKRNKNAKLFYFENIFESENKYNNLKKLINYATSFKDFENIKYKNFNGILEKKVYENPSCEFPHWKDWSKNYKKQFTNICEPLMSKLGYGNEKEWK